MTAVEWLVSELTEVDRNLINKTFLQLNNSLAGHRLKDITKEAKEMERQQIEKAYNSAVPFKFGKEYYEKTYKHQSNKESL